MAERSPRPVFARVATLVAVVTIAVAVAQFGYEFTVPEHGAARDAERDTALPLALRWGGAALVSLASLLLLLAARRDRGAVSAGDDRLVGSYWGFGLVMVVLGAATGAAPAMLVVTGCLVLLSAWRAADRPDDLIRTAQALVFAVVAVHVLALGVRLLIGTYLRWQHGFAPQDEVERLRADWHVAAVQDVFVLLAFASTLLLPLLLWRRRDQVPAARGQLSWSCVGVVVVAVAALDYLGALVGLACLAGVRLTRPDPARSVPSREQVAGPAPRAVVLPGGAGDLAGSPDPFFWLPGPVAGQSVESWLPEATAHVEALAGRGAPRRGIAAPDLAAQLRAAVATDPATPDLPGRLLHWRDLRRGPVVARFGVVPAARAEEIVRRQVSPGAPPPPVARLATPTGTTARRWVVRVRESGRDVLEMRYLVEDGADLAVVLLARDSGGGLFHLQDSLDAFVTGLTVQVAR